MHVLRTSIEASIEVVEASIEVVEDSFEVEEGFASIEMVEFFMNFSWTSTEKYRSAEDLVGQPYMRVTCITSVEAVEASAEAVER